MVDPKAICCMCGDVGFSDKLFQCSCCRYRSQHSYCSSYYKESSEMIKVCDWCRSDEKYSNYASSSTKKASAHATGLPRGVTNNRCESAEKKSSRTATRRYKLLKDVMC